VPVSFGSRFTRPARFKVLPALISARHVGTIDFWWNFKTIQVYIQYTCTIHVGSFRQLFFFLEEKGSRGSTYRPLRRVSKRPWSRTQCFEFVCYLLFTVTTLLVKSQPLSADNSLLAFKSAPSEWYIISRCILLKSKRSLKKNK